MTTASGKGFGVGLRHVRIFELSPATGYIAAPDETAYEGLQLVSGKSISLTNPEPRRITHTGDDRVQAQDFLPPLEGSAGELRVGANDYDIYAILTGTKKSTVGESTGIGWATDLQGSEPIIGVHAYQQSIDAATKVRRWKSYILPVALAIPRPANLDDNAEEHIFNLLPQVASKHIWGAPFTLATDGFTEAQFIERTTIYKPKIVAFLGDGTTTAFNFPATAQAVNTTGMVVWKNGTELTAGITKAVSGVTITVAPAVGDVVVVWYEHA